MVAAELHQKAFQQGSVRVMVEFEAPYVPEAHLPTAAHVLAQRQSIAALQGVVQGSLRGVSHRVVRDFHGAAPVLVVQVGSEGLRQLESLRGVVARVVEDRPRRPALSESVPRIQADQAWRSATTGPAWSSSSWIPASRRTIHSCKTAPGLPGSSAKRASRAMIRAPSRPACALARHRRLAARRRPTRLGAACPPTIDGCNHGTLVAGIAAGRAPTSTGRAGRRPHLDPGLLAVQ